MPAPTELENITKEVEEFCEELKGNCLRPMVEELLIRWRTTPENERVSEDELKAELTKKVNDVYFSSDNFLH